MVDKKYIAKSVYVASYENWNSVQQEFEDLLNNPPNGYEVDNYFYTPNSKDDYATWQVVYKKIPAEAVVAQDNDYRKFKL